jgi:endonuclease-3
LNNITELVTNLSKLYGMPKIQPHGDPLAELIMTVLSQNTSDKNSGRAFMQLLRNFDDWNDVANATTKKIEKTIRSGGLAKQKAPRIKVILQEVYSYTNGTWNLDMLATKPVEDARAWLLSLPGVGPKTAACVLLFALNRPALPVDTHVERVSKRLELITEKTPLAKAHIELEKLVPPDMYYSFHMLMIKHGRRICSALKPRCIDCPLQRNCPSRKKYETTKKY